MELFLLNLFPVALFIMTFYGAKLSKKKEVSPDFLSLEQGKLIQGFACIAIIMHHLTQQITSYGTYIKGPVTIFNYAGILFTSIFFFFSGYGLIVSLYTKENYLKNFLKKRLPTVLIPFWVVNILGVLLTKFVYGSKDGTIDVIKDIFGITLINSNGWFIVEIVIFYLIFYVLFSLIKKKDISLFLMCVSVVLIIRYAYFKGHDPEGNKAHWFAGEWWYNSTIVFVFGMLYGRFKEKLTAFFNRFYVFFLLITTVLFGVMFGYSIRNLLHFGYYIETYVGIYKYGKLITLLSQSTACILSTLLVVLLNMRIRLGNPVLKYISGISVELFLIHGYFVNRIYGDMTMSDPLRFTAVYASSIALTALVSPAVKFLIKKTVAFLNPPPKTEAEKKTKRKVHIKLLIIAIVVLILTLTVGRLVRDMINYSSECKAIKNANVGDEVKWGRFDMDGIPGRERWSWIVVKKDGNKVMLLSKQGVDGECYNHKHMAVTWMESDLRKMLHSKTFIKSFSSGEFKNIVNTNGDVITLLTPEEAAEVFDTDEKRQLSVTELAMMKGTNTNVMSKYNYWDMKDYRSSWWWLKGAEEAPDIYAPIVTVDGEISVAEKEVNRPNGAIRPVIWVDVTSEN